jgi:hypothetical protein
MTLSVDRVCGEEGRALFGTSRKPSGQPGLNASNIDPAYDVVAVDQDVIYSAIMTHRKRIKRILYVGVHLELCILYSRWFSLLRVAKFWNLGDDVRYGVVVPLVDVSNTHQDEHYSLQTKRDPTAVAAMACWIRDTAAPKFLAGRETIDLYDWQVVDPSTNAV